jgi:predicted DCC family thiol-disulfide oxidoreductase YuxK
MRNSEKLVILFDGSCNFCTATAELLRVLDWRHRLHCLPFQKPGVPQAYGLSVAQCERIVWAISPDGGRFPASRAVSAALDAIVGFPLFLFLYKLPFIGQIEDKVYTWVASHRQFFPGIRPFCERPGSPCGT